MNQEFEIIFFELFNLKLQEPMSLVTNWMTASFCLFAAFKLKGEETNFMVLWRRFFLYLGISTALGGLGHLFFQYTGIYGKMPSWSFAIFSGLFVSFAMLSLVQEGKWRSSMTGIVLFKSALLLIYALWFQKFLFVAIDAIMTYLIICGGSALYFSRKFIPGMREIILGVLILLPSAFIFLMNVNVHRFLNRDDISHLLMLGCAISFYAGVKKFGAQALKVSK